MLLDGQQLRLHIDNRLDRQVRVAADLGNQRVKSRGERLVGAAVDCPDRTADVGEAAADLILGEPEFFQGGGAVLINQFFAGFDRDHGAGQGMADGIVDFTSDAVAFCHGAHLFQLQGLLAQRRQSFFKAAVGKQLLFQHVKCAKNQDEKEDVRVDAADHFVGIDLAIALPRFYEINSQVEAKSDQRVDPRRLQRKTVDHDGDNGQDKKLRAAGWIVELDGEDQEDLDGWKRIIEQDMLLFHKQAIQDHDDKAGGQQPDHQEIMLICRVLRQNAQGEDFIRDDQEDKNTLLDLAVDRLVVAVVFFDQAFFTGQE